MQGGLGMLMTACPQLIWDWEEKSTVRIRIAGGILAIIGTCGSISGYQQQEKLATKDDLSILATKADIVQAINALSGSNMPGVRVDPLANKNTPPPERAGQRP